MKINDMSSNGLKSTTRIEIESADGNPSKQATSTDNSKVFMNTPEMKERGFRTDQLLEAVGMDNYSLKGEQTRMSKMKG